MSRAKIILFFAALTFAAFGNTLGRHVIGDDQTLFERNTFYRKPQNLGRLFSRSFIQDSGQTIDLPGHEASFSGCISYRPVTALSFFLDRFLWRDHPWGYHLTNVLLHLAAVLLFYDLVRSLTGRGVWAWLAAVLFCTHPVHSELVANIGYRSDLLAGVFLLGAFRFYRRCRTAGGSDPDPRSRPRDFGLSLAGLALALFSKENSLMFVALVPLYDLFWAPSRGELAAARAGGWQLFFRRNLRFYAAIAAVAAFYLFVYLVLVPGYHYPNALGLLGMSPWTRLGVGVKVLAHYLTVLLLPFRAVVLPPMYAPAVLSFPWREAAVALAAAALSVLAARRWFRQDPWLVFGLLWFWLFYLPVSNLVWLPNPMAYRFLYLPSMGFCLALAVAWDKVLAALRRRTPTGRTQLLLMFVLVGLNLAVTVPLNEFFKDNRVAAREMIRNFPDSSRPYWILGLSYSDGGEPARAVPYFEAYLEQGPRNPFVPDPRRDHNVYNRLGLCYPDDPDRAIGYFVQAVRLQPDFFLGHLNLARAYLQKGDCQSALQYARHAVELYPPFLPGYIYAVHCLAELGEFDQAEEFLRRARALEPQHPFVAAVARRLELKKEGR